MTGFLGALLTMSALGSALACLLFLLKPLLRRGASRAFSYYLWLIVLLRLCLPFGVTLAVPVPASDVAPVVTTPSAELPAPPADAEAYLPPADASFVPAEDVLSAAPAPVALSNALKSPGLWLGVWALGALLTLCRYTLGYVRFTRLLRREAAEPSREESAAFSRFPESCRVRLFKCGYVGSPMLIGLFRPAVVLPEASCTPEALDGVLCHELTHCRRWDLAYKWFAMVVTALHWFNPLVYPIRREIDRCCELACDEAVVRGMDGEARARYGETLLELAGSRAAPAGVLATTLCEEKNQLRERLMSIRDRRRTSPAAVALCATLAVVLTGCAAINGAEGAPAPTPAPVASEPTRAPEWGPQDEIGIIAQGVAIEVNPFDGSRWLAITFPNWSDVWKYEVLIFGSLKDSGEPFECVANITERMKYSQADYPPMYSFPLEEWSDYEELKVSVACEGCEIAVVNALAEYRKSFDIALYENQGLELAVTNLYGGELTVLSRSDDSRELFSLYERRSREQELADKGSSGGAGFIMDIVRFDRAEYEAYLAGSMEGARVFAKDGEYYYCRRFATDVRLYRSGGASGTDWEQWQILNSYALEVTEDFVSRNGLEAYDDSEFWHDGYSYGGPHRLVEYCPEGGGALYTLTLSQPRTLGERGVWCVERWSGAEGEEILYFPAADYPGVSAREFYSEQQETVDDGKRLYLRDPLRVAEDFIETKLGLEVKEGELTEA